MCKCGIYKQTLPKALGDVNQAANLQQCLVPNSRPRARGLITTHCPGLGLPPAVTQAPLSVTFPTTHPTTTLCICVCVCVSLLRASTDTGAGGQGEFTALAENNAPFDASHHSLFLLTRTNQFAADRRRMKFREGKSE